MVEPILNNDFLEKKIKMILFINDLNYIARMFYLFQLNFNLDQFIIFKSKF